MKRVVRFTRVGCATERWEKVEQQVMYCVVVVLALWPDRSIVTTSFKLRQLQLEATFVQFSRRQKTITKSGPESQN